MRRLWGLVAGGGLAVLVVCCAPAPTATPDGVEKPWKPSPCEVAGRIRAKADKLYAAGRLLKTVGALNRANDLCPASLGDDGQALWVRALLDVGDVRAAHQLARRVLADPASTDGAKAAAQEALEHAEAAPASASKLADDLGVLRRYDAARAAPREGRLVDAERELEALMGTPPRAAALAYAGLAASGLGRRTDAQRLFDRSVVAFGREGTLVRGWTVRRPVRSAGSLGRVAWAADGALIQWPVDYGASVAVDVSRGQPVFQCCRSGSTGNAKGAAYAFSPNMRWFATVDASGRVRLMHVTSGQEFAAIAVKRPASCAADEPCFALAVMEEPEPRVIVEGTEAVTLWCPVSGQSSTASHPRAAYPAPVPLVAPDRGSFALHRRSDEGGWVDAWQLSGGACAIPSKPAVSAAADFVTYSPHDSSLLVLGGNHLTTYAAAGNVLAEAKLPGSTRSIWPHRADAAKWLLYLSRGDLDHHVAQWDVLSGEVDWQTTWSGRPKQVPSGELLSWQSDGQPPLVDVAAKRSRKIGWPRGVGVRPSPDGKLGYAAVRTGPGPDGLYVDQVGELESGKVISRWRAQGPRVWVGFDAADGSLLTMANRGLEVLLLRLRWSIHGGRTRLEETDAGVPVNRRTKVRARAKDMEVLLVVDSKVRGDRTIGVRTSSGRELARRSYRAEVFDIRISSSDAFAAVSTYWMVSAVALPHLSEVCSVRRDHGVISPDDRVLATTESGVVEFWSLDDCSWLGALHLGTRVSDSFLLAKDGRIELVGEHAHELGICRAGPLMLPLHTCRDAVEGSGLLSVLLGNAS